jgi:hypothetical protein
VRPDPLLRVRLRDGHAASLRLACDATVLAVGDETVSSFDLAGRPYALVRDGRTWRRALDGRFLVKGGQDHRLRVEAAEGRPIAAAARREAASIAEALAAQAVDAGATVRDEALRRLGLIAGMDDTALDADTARYRAAYRGGVGILPPDQYLSLVVQLTEGCSWNACTFCDFYRHTRFHVRSLDELAAHVEAVRAFFGPALALRRTLFLGDANALCVGHERLLPLLEYVSARFPVAAPGLEARERRAWLSERAERMEAVSAFVDAFSGAHKNADAYREYARLGLRRVYVGLESGDPELLRWLDKPGSPEEAAQLVGTLRGAGVAVGVIVLLGAGGETFFATHASRTAELLRRLGLGPADLLYFSELVESDGLPYAERAARDGIRPLTAARFAEQRRLVLEGVSASASQPGPRTASYDIREFVY